MPNIFFRCSSDINLIVVFIVFSSVSIESETKPISSDIMEALSARKETDAMYPKFENQQIFRLPKKLCVNDEIVVAGNRIGSPLRLDLNLVTGADAPDYRNVALQFQVLGSNNPDDHIIINTIKHSISNPKTHVIASPEDYFPGTNFFVILKIVSIEDSSTIMFEIKTNDTIIDYVELNHALTDIAYLSLNSDIKLNSLRFNFA